MRRSLVSALLCAVLAAFASSPAMAAFSLGIGITDTDQGVEVNWAPKAGAAHEAGVRFGDLVVKADHHATPSGAHLIAAVRRAGADGATSIALTLKRDGADLLVEVPIGRRDDTVGLREETGLDDGPLAMILAMNGLSKFKAVCAQDRVLASYSDADRSKLQALLAEAYRNGEGGVRTAETLTVLIGDILRAGHCSVTAQELRGELYPVKPRFETRLGLRVRSDGGALIGSSGAGPNLALANIGALGRAIDIGALVTEVSPDSPAAKAGLEPGMVILSINGRRVNGKNLDEATRSFPPGHAVELRVIPRSALRVQVYDVAPTD